mgnify:CR=1 FL=1
MADTLYGSVTGCSQLESITVTDSHTAPTATATIQCQVSSLDVGDSVNVNLGYTSGHNKVFSGYVKSVKRSEQPTRYEITCANAMIRAVDYFIASSNPSQPYSKENISAEDLVKGLMQMAGLSVSAESTNFTFATKGYPLEVNLTSVYDFCKFVAGALAWSLWANENGVVQFKPRPPYPDGDSSVATLDNTNLVDVSYSRSDRDLRNRIVVYGSEGVFAEAKESSPYLPAGFYKTSVLAAPTLIDSEAIAQQAADYNLSLFNRLTVGGSATIYGDSSISCRDCVEVNKSDIGMNGQFYVYGIEHTWGKEGYTTSMELRQ